MKKMLLVVLTITTLFGCNKGNADKKPKLLVNKPKHLVNIDLLGGYLHDYRNSLKKYVEHGDTIPYPGIPRWNNGYEYAGGWETADGETFNFAKAQSSDSTEGTKIRKELTIRPKIRFDKDQANNIENSLNAIFKKNRDIKNLKSKINELAALLDNAKRDLTDNSTKFIKTAINLQEARINSNKDAIITLNNKSKEIDKLIAEMRRYFKPNPYIADDYLHQYFVKSEIPASLINTMKKIENHALDEKYEEAVNKCNTDNQQNILPGDDIQIQKRAEKKVFEIFRENFSEQIKLAEERIRKKAYREYFPSSDEIRKRAEEKVLKLNLKSNADFQEVLKCEIKHKKIKLNAKRCSACKDAALSLKNSQAYALDKEYKELAVSMPKNNNFSLNALSLDSYSIIKAINLLEALSKDNDNDEYKTSYGFSDIIKQDDKLNNQTPLGKLLHETYKKEKENRKKEALDEMQNIIKAYGLKELEAKNFKMDIVIDLRRQAEDLELQSTQTIALLPSIALKNEAAVRRTIADTIEKQISDSGINLEENSAGDKEAEATGIIEMINERREIYGLKALKDKLKPARKSLLGTFQNIYQKIVDIETKKAMESFKSQADVIENIKSDIKKLNSIPKTYRERDQYNPDNYKKIIKKIESDIKKLNFADAIKGIEEIKNGIGKSKSEIDDIVTAAKLFEQEEDIKSQIDIVEKINSNNPKLNDKINNSVNYNKKIIVDGVAQLFKQVENLKRQNSKIQKVKYSINELKSKVDISAESSLPNNYKESIEKISSDINKIFFWNAAESIKQYASKINKLIKEPLFSTRENGYGEISKLSDYKKIIGDDVAQLFKQAENLKSQANAIKKIKSDIKKLKLSAPDADKKSIENIISNIKELKLSAGFKNIDNTLNELKNATDNSANYKEIVGEAVEKSMELLILDNYKKTMERLSRSFNKLGEKPIIELKELAKDLESEIDDIIKSKELLTPSGHIFANELKENFQSQANANKNIDKSKLKTKSQGTLAYVQKTQESLQLQADTIENIKKNIDKLKPKTDVSISLEKLEEEFFNIKKIKSDINGLKFRAARDTAIDIRKKAENLLQEATTKTDLKSAAKLRIKANALINTANKIEIEGNLRYPIEEVNENIEYIAEEKRKERQKIYALDQLSAQEKDDRQHLLQSYNYYENIKDAVLGYQANIKKLVEEFNLLKGDFRKNYGDFPSPF
ncbi:hypothetical protein [Candidatus Endomicrobiellum agilis]|uniref:hypothetical protein n=1 Tax=Candidatus Endomicrobiellum agilis TaxID=3238957 RepID=UPI0035837E2B|nr:hypothetical protein [Endomicrobium sp.]